MNVNDAILSNGALVTHLGRYDLANSWQCLNVMSHPNTAAPAQRDIYSYSHCKHIRVQTPACQCQQRDFSN